MSSETSIEILKLWVVPKDLADESSVQVGYGRDLNEARAHARISDVAGTGDATEMQATVTVHNAPQESDHESKAICRAICDFHLEKDENVSEDVKRKMWKLIEGRLYADAVRVCFDEIWDQKS
jgi:hypothetical protein